jgi:hypothetical protein
VYLISCARPNTVAALPVFSPRSPPCSRSRSSSSSRRSRTPRSFRLHPLRPQVPRGEHPDQRLHQDLQLWTPLVGALPSAYIACSIAFSRRQAISLRQPHRRRHLDRQPVQPLIVFHSCRSRHLPSRALPVILCRASVHASLISRSTYTCLGTDLPSAFHRPSPDLPAAYHRPSRGSDSPFDQARQPSASLCLRIAHFKKKYIQEEPLTIFLDLDVKP